MTNTTEQPKEIMGVYDNKGYTMDNYTIWVLFESGESFLIATNGVASIWSIGENESVSVDDLKDDEEYKKHIGEEIDWNTLSQELQETINGYFDNFTYDF